MQLRRSSLKRRIALSQRTLSSPSPLRPSPLLAGYKGGDGIPPWKRYEKKGLSRAAEATLETVWSRTQWPSDDIISSMWDLHRLRKDQVITWFQERRRVVRSGGKGGGKSGSGAAAATEPGTDWDDEWITLEAPPPGGSEPEDPTEW